MHGQVPLQGQVLMGAGSMKPAYYLRHQEVQLQIGWNDYDRAIDAFHALADGGDVIMPFEETFWSPEFSMLRDHFGVMWMINVNGEDA